MILDFKEIPITNNGKGMQDAFELFARDFFEVIGFTIVESPYRGADGKKDLIVSETRKGVGGKTEHRWLVSCKHYSNSGKAVRDVDEPNIADRVKRHKCHGFIGFYSTIPASSLANNLKAFESDFGVLTFDAALIEKKLLKSTAGKELASRYFPGSLSTHIRNHPKTQRIFKSEPIKCEYCGKELLTMKNFGIWVGLTSSRMDKGDGKIHTHDAYFSCKGECDFRMKTHHRRRGYRDYGWLELAHFTNPREYLQEMFDYMERTTFIMHEPAREKFKQILREGSKYVMRELTDSEMKHVIPFL